jgi:Uncharacterized conserved protein
MKHQHASNAGPLRGHCVNRSVGVLRHGGISADCRKQESPSGKAPEGMVWIPGGEFSMGAAVGGEGSHAMPMASNDSQPVHRVYVDAFWMDATPVTNAQFEKFVRATNYVTIAERTPSKEEFPTAPEENLVAGAVVFAPTITKCRSTIIINGGRTSKRELASPVRSAK